MECRLDVRSRRPADWGRYPSFSIVFNTRRRVFSPTDDTLPLMTLETVAKDTSAAAATSFIVGLIGDEIGEERLVLGITFYDNPNLNKKLANDADTMKNSLYANN